MLNAKQARLGGQLGQLADMKNQKVQVSSKGTATPQPTPAVARASVGQGQAAAVPTDICHGSGAAPGRAV